jgi:hypothetical protein
MAAFHPLLPLAAHIADFAPRAIIDRSMLLMLIALALTQLPSC